MDAAKELLMFGLKGTDLEALVAIGNGEDGGRCVVLQVMYENAGNLIYRRLNVFIL